MIYLWISTMSLFLQQISTNYDSITNPRHGPHSYLQTRTNIIFKVATPRLQRYHSVLPTPTLMGPTKHGALISSHFTNIDVLYTSVALNFVLFAGYSVQIYIPLGNFTLSRLWWLKDVTLIPLLKFTQSYLLPNGQLMTWNNGVRLRTLKPQTPIGLG